MMNLKKVYEGMTEEERVEFFSYLERAVINRGDSPLRIHATAEAVIELADWVYRNTGKDLEQYT